MRPLITKHKPFSQRLLDLRNQAKLTTVRLGKLSGIDPDRIRTFINGYKKSYPTSTEAAWLCMALRCSKQELLGTNYHPPSGPHQIEILVTKHAKQRYAERGIDGVFVRNAVVLPPYEEGNHKWYIPRTNLYVSYIDTGGWRVIVTAGVDAGEPPEEKRELS